MNTLRPLDLPRPLAIETDARGDPAIVVWRGRRLRVAALLDRWRIDDEWWRTPIARLYHALALTDGRTLVVFHDLIGGGWYEQRYGLRHLTPSPFPEREGERSEAESAEDAAVGGWAGGGTPLLASPLGGERNEGGRVAAEDGALVGTGATNPALPKAKLSLPQRGRGLERRIRPILPLCAMPLME